MIINANIESGINKFSELPKIIKKLGYNSPCVLVDRNLYNGSDFVSKVINNSIPDSGIIFYDHPFEPSYQMLDSMMKKINANKILEKIDVLIGIGGGSTMDTAKGLAILCNNPGPSIQYKGFPTELAKPLPVIAVPSTTGTGSEVVFNASFIDEKTKIKMGINYDKNYPVMAILDPLIPSSAPINILASSGCDALVHSLESFMSINGNPQASFFSKRAYSLIMKYMPLLLNGENDLDNWLQMQWAAVYAMFALSNSTPGPAGVLSYYLGTHFKVNHGVAGGAFIGKVCKYNHENGYYNLSMLYQNDNNNQLNEKEKSGLVIKEIQDLLKMANIPKNLNEFGVDESSYGGFNKFAAEAMAAFNFNPIKIDPDRVADLFLKN